MARILCVNPWIVDFAAHNVWIEPLGLLTVAGILRAAGHDVALLDCLDRHHPLAPAPYSERDRFGCGHFAKVELRKPPAIAHIPRHWGRYGLPLELVRHELSAQARPDAVLVTSGMTYWYEGLRQAIDLVKQVWPTVPVALGGIYATLCAEHARRTSGADAVLPGRGELSALEWVNEVTGDRRAPRDAEAEILPAHELRRPQGYITVQTARGCPFRCPYCASQLLEPAGFVRRSPQSVVREIDQAVRALAVQDVAFYDDALLYQAQHHIHRILDGLLKAQVGVRLHSPNGLHARFVDLPLAQKMRHAGFVTIRLGLETIDPLQSRHDGDKVDQCIFARAVGSFLTAGFSAEQIGAYVLIARPRQDVAAVRATVRFAHSLGITVLPAEYSPIPGTAEWREAVELGYIAADADPLLHSNHAYPCAHWQEWEDLKQEIRSGNHTLRANVDSPMSSP